MKKVLKYSYPALLICITGITVLLSSCLKKSDSEIKKSVSLPFKGIDMVKTLAAQINMKLFYQALNRAGLAGTIDPSKNFTIFVPTDSVMTAAGLDIATINKLSVDSLRRLINYQIAPGATDDMALTNLSISRQTATLLQDTVYQANGSSSAAPAPFYVHEVSNVLYMNGIAVAKAGSIITTANGYIYPVKALNKPIPAKRSIYDLINADPDLSMYKQALILNDMIRDSAIYSVFGLSDPYSLDVYAYSNPPEFDLPNCLPTVLAPTNKAFNDAGFHTIADLRKYATRSYVGLDLNTFNSFYYSPLDSVLKHHVLYNENMAGSQSIGITRIFYIDMTTQRINNGNANVYVGPGATTTLGVTAFWLQFQTPLTFSTNGGNAYVTWVPSTPAVEVIPPATPDGGTAFNGQLYKVNKLFYPAVK